MQKTKIVEFIKVLVFCALVAFVVSLLLNKDFYKGIFFGVFIFSLYYFHKPKESSPIDMSSFKNSIFPVKLYRVTIEAVLLLSFVSLITGVLHWFLIDPCEKGSLAFSKERCAIKQVKEKFYESESDSYEDESGDRLFSN